MIRFSIIFICVILQTSSMSGQEWQEHLSHDRRAYAHLGYFVIDGQIALLMGNQKTPMNTLEVITGNTKKEQEVIGKYFTFRTKTTTTGIDSKEILLMQAFDYDIPGFGAFSIHGNSNDYTIRDIYGNSNFDDVEFYIIDDAHLLGGPLESKQCVAEGRRYYMNEDDNITFDMPTEGILSFHEGLDGDAYQIWNGLMRRLDPPTNGTIDLEDYDALYNNPFENQLIVRNGNNLSRYSYENLSFLRSDNLMSHPLDIQFVEGGFYYLAESDENYMIFYFSDENSDSELFYELPKTDEIAEFRIRNFEVIGDDIYFIGLWRSPLIREFFSYVQKRTLNEEFTPIRKDIELVSATATREAINYNNYNYTYQLTVKNLSEDTIRHFTAYADLFIEFSPAQYHKTDVSLVLPPGETQVIEREFIHYSYPLNALTFEIEGVDFGIDSDVTNNSFTADVIILSNNETELNAFSIAPSLSSDFISIKGNQEKIESMVITNIKGHRMEISRDYKQIDISSLPNGQYWLEIQTKSRVEQHPFMKI